MPGTALPPRPTHILVSNSSDELISREGVGLECVVVHISHCVQLYIPLSAHCARRDLERSHYEWAVVYGLRAQSAGARSRVYVAPLDPDRHQEVEGHEADDEHLPADQGLARQEGILAVPLLGDGVLLVHVLGQLEVEERHFVQGEVRGQGHVDGAAAVRDAPLGVVVLLGAELANILDEVLSLESAGERERLLEVCEISSGLPAVDAAALDDVGDAVLVHLLQLLGAARVELLEFLLENRDLRVSFLSGAHLEGQLVAGGQRHQEGRHRALALPQHQLAASNQASREIARVEHIF